MTAASSDPALPALAASLEAAAREHGPRVALESTDERVTYAALLEGAAALAARLRGAGLGRDEAVLVACSNHASDFVAFLGVWLARGVVVPVHRTSPAAVVGAIQLKACSRFRVDLLAADILEPLDAKAPDDPARSRLLADAALVIFTSGSTGLPKGVVLSHTAFARKLAQNQRVFELSRATTTLLVLNDTFSFGIWVALLTLQHGGTLRLHARFDPAAFLDALAGGVTFTGVVPTMIRATFAAIDENGLAAWRARAGATSALRTMAIGGEPLGIDLSARLRALIAPAQLYDVYGLTETATSDFILDPADYHARPGSIGRPAPGIRFRIQRDAAAAPDAPGELQLQTPTLMAGYLGDPALTQAAFADGWFRTGDLVTDDGDGFVSIVGRSKDLMVRGGNKITPLEVERALCRCDGVAAALVAGLPDPVVGERICALLIAVPGATIDAAALRAQLADTLEKYKHPDQCYVGTDLPTGRTGKIERGRLAAFIAANAVAPLAGWVR